MVPETSREPKVLAAEVQRRLRGRNRALMLVLVGLVVLFYAISIVKFRVHG